MSNARGFAGLHVSAFESRRAPEMARLIERAGGVAHVSPSMREVPIAENRAAIDFANRVVTGQIDIVIFMTGVGVRHLIAEVERYVDRPRFLAALSDVTTIARGPKPVAVLKEFGLEPTVRVPEPNTWREVLATIDLCVPVAQQNVGLLEYGRPNASLVAGLEARGARVEAVRVYRWDLPEDIAPLSDNLRAIAAGQRQVALFTSSHQVVNMLRVAEELGLVEKARQSLERMAIASIGPTTSETLRELDLPVDLEPEHNKMGQLVALAAERSRSVLASKRSGSLHALAPQTPARPRAERGPRPEIVPPASGSPAPAGPAADSLFLRACRRQPVERTPIWLMRQAGRYMSEYREIRRQTTFLALCKNPQLCAEVMLTAVARLGVDAAIIFSDLLPILEPLGFQLEFAEGEGPVIHNPLREPSDLNRMRPLEDVGSLEFVMETVRLTRAGLPAHIPVIGFAGAPFTLASYAVEGGASRQYLHTKGLMYRDPGAWHELMSRLARAVTLYLNAQIAAGAEAVQLFDSWVGTLGPDDYRRSVLPYTQAVIDGLTPGVPVIHFAAGNPTLLPLVAEAGGDVIGVDWRIDLDTAWQLVGPDRAVQGNLDPAVLLADRDEIRRRAAGVLAQVGGRPGHIFNLGHGIHQQTPVENVIALIEFVRQLSTK
ncbi:MAG TPA: uroporphyrinogen decarboxylase [Pirellulales bacterium]|jgi:uroporphyrinogen decarboxylase|nr:uroporphyrinogen decarboxylase [Pirellulales bacterium]